MLDQLTATDFDALVGTAFTAETPHESAALDLIEVTKLREPPARPGAPVRRAPFSLTFRTRTPKYIPQGVFALSHDRLGRIDVFMVPVGWEPGGLLLEAVFN
ncbi:MAG TPA: hypothetical protein VGE74_17130 [Gemmata sp.]